MLNQGDKVKIKGNIKTQIRVMEMAENNKMLDQKIVDIDIKNGEEGVVIYAFENELPQVKFGDFPPVPVEEQFLTKL